MNCLQFDNMKGRFIDTFEADISLGVVQLRKLIGIIKEVIKFLFNLKI